jgi:hypothetical protein
VVPNGEARPPHYSSANLDLGPTYAEELLLKEEAARQQEQAILKHLFEHDLRLREQINQLQG